MKKLLVGVAFFLSAYTFSQTIERKTLYKGSFDIVQKIKDSKDTSTYLYYGFQNQKYKQISDIGGFLLVSKEEAEILSKELLEFSNKEERISLTKKLDFYSLELYDFSDKIYIFDTDRKYTSISKKKAKEMANEINEQKNLLK